MSAATRAAIATAASTLAAVNCSPYYRQSTKVGDAFVRLDRRARDDSGFGFIETWQVVIALPQDIVAAEKWLDANDEALTAAIAAELIVTTVTPSELVFDTGRVPAVVIEGNRAS